MAKAIAPTVRTEPGTPATKKLAVSSRIERMVANPSIESLDSIAMALGLSPAELFRIDEVDILPEQYDEFRHLRGISSTMEPWRKSLFLRVVSSTLNALRDWKPVEEPEKTEQE